MTFIQIQYTMKHSEKMKKYLSILLLFAAFCGYGQTKISDSEQILIMERGERIDWSKINWDGLTTVTGFLTDSLYQIFKAVQQLKYSQKQDTQRVLMLIIDTSAIKISQYGLIKAKSDTIYEFHTDCNVNWQYGYEVTEIETSYADWRVRNNGCLDSNMNIIPCYNKYLDADKQPIKKSIVIFQTIPLK